jgi:hypothetical protein
MVVSMVAGFLPLAVWGVRTDNVHLLWSALAVFMAARVVTLEVARRRVVGRRVVGREEAPIRGTAGAGRNPEA